MKVSSLSVLAALAAPSSSTAFHVEEVPVPMNGADKHANIGTSKITINGTSYETGYIDILKSGDSVDGVMFGQVLDEKHEPIYAYPMDDDYVEMPLGNDATTDLLVSNIPDFTSLIKAPESSATEFAMFAHFETPLPAQIYRINVDFDDDCTLMVNSLEATNWSAWGGLWEPCSAKVSPWNTHMGSEEHEPDAKIMTYSYDKFVKSYEEGDPTPKNIMHFMRYYGLYSDALTNDADMEALRRVFNPYKFGHVTELSIDEETGETITHKWYTCGRISIENPAIMPDNKTIYVADDASFGIIVRCVMETPGDLSSATIYASNWTQLDAADGGSFDIGWVELGKGTQDELLGMVDGLTFDQIFEEGEVADSTKGTCVDDSFTFVKVGHYTKEECLKLKDGMKKKAAFFETRRYAAYIGATAEMQSLEGMAVVSGRDDGEPTKFYASMSKVSNGMDDETLPLGHIAVPNNKCGCVYEFDVDEETMALTAARGLVCGESNDSDPLNACSTDSIASPDNLFYMGDVKSGDDHAHQLLIAEDTSYHQNDYLWMYDLDHHNMTRILSTVYGSQVTGPGYYSDGKGCYLLVAVVPHPYKKSDKEMYNETGSIGLAGSVGYIGPIGSRLQAGVDTEIEK